MQEILAAQRSFFESGQPRSISFRLEQLRRLERGLNTYESQIMDALEQDLGKTPFESYESEIGMVKAELRYVMHHLRKWARPKRVRVPLTHFPASAKIIPEPYGAVLILAPWNYPFQLAVEPLISALAAGNCAVVKPSEFAVHTEAVLKRMLEELFEPEVVRVVCGGMEVSQALLEEPFDMIFFTGSPAVGKLVMQAAAQHLTPVVLELGGKSPCVVDSSADIPLAARRIAWGKFLNAGQTCVAPDYVLVQESVRETLVRELKQQIHHFYGDHPLRCEDYPKILREAHFERLRGLMEGCAVLSGGGADKDMRKIEPTLLGDVSWESPVMQEEIFGPLLPIVSFDRTEEALEQIRRQPHPLALYLFTGSKAVEKQFMEGLSFGGGCVNDTLMHMTLPELPFGGVGNSGMGAYHGKAGFDAFSRQKSVMRRGLKPDLSLRYPPYDGKLRLLKKLLK